MSKYSSKLYTVNQSAEKIADKFSDLTQFQEAIDSLPEAQREQLQSIKFDTDSITLTTSQVGDVKFKIVERNPHIIKLEGVATPMPVAMQVDLKEVQPDTTDMTTTFDIQLPMMIRPMVGPYMQKAVDMVAEILAKMVVK